MNNQPNNDATTPNSGDDKKQQIDKLNSLIQDLQKSVDSLQNEIQSDKINNSNDASAIKTNKASTPTNEKSNADNVTTKSDTDHIDEKASITQDAVSNKVDLSQSDPNSAEYVTPVFYTKHYKKSKRRKRNRDEDKNRIIPNKMVSNSDNVIDDYVFASPHKKKKKTKKQKALRVVGIIFAVILGLIIVAVSSVLIMNQVGKNEMHNYDDINITPSPEIEDISVEDNGRTITYKGHTYGFNEKVTSCVIMGVDKDSENDKTNTGMGGQADAIYIAIINTSEKKISMLGVSRDSIVDVNTYDSNGNFIDTTPMQLCLSYAFGDGKESSCDNTIRSLERLFYGMPFDTYFSFDFVAMRTLNDLVGGVTLKSSITFTGRKGTGRIINEGDTVTLTADEAQEYIQERDVEQLTSNAGRMERQKQYISAFLSQVIPAAKNDLSVVTNMYGCVSDHSTTNLTTPKITYLASTALSGIGSYKDIEFVNVPGQIVKGEKYTEFHVDEAGLMQLMLDLFYVKIN